ncbi:MAG: helix-turn-helix domain-containing protein [Lachnospiraceae bacterium]|nr:helix-turn-helix domain-containing protein [Lachnospiraceae bacterium]
MDQIKTGNLIAQCRKEKGLTQAALAEQLGVSDRAVSKWETGRSLPDADNMLELSRILGITVDELLKGEKTDEGGFNQMAETINKLNTKQQEEETNKKMLRHEVVIGLIGTIAFVAFVLIAALIPDVKLWIRLIIIIFGAVLFAVSMYYAIKIEREVGYYECPDCGHRYVPGMAAFINAPHMGRTRKMKCPQCGRRNWQKKVLTKN